MTRLTISGSGLALAVTAVLGYTSGVLLGYPLLVAIAVGALAILACGAVAVAIRPAVSITRQVTPVRVTVGESAKGRLDIRNSSRWPAPSFTAIDRAGTETIELSVSTVAPAGTRRIAYEVPAPRRGRLRLGPLTVRRRDPLGLFTWAQRQTADGILWAHPRVHPIRPLPLGVVPDYEGRSTQTARLGTVTFSSLREYTPGDDPRRIHWRSTARLGTLIVREHVDTSEPTTTVVLDTRPEVLDPDAFEEAVEVAASVVRAVEQIGRPVALHIVGERPDRVAAENASSSLDRLSLAAPSKPDDPVGFLDAVDRIAGGGVLAVVTGDAEPGVLARLAEQRRRFAPVVVICLLPSEPGTGPAMRRRPGLAVLTARSAAGACAEWNRMVHGEGS